MSGVDKVRAAYQRDNPQKDGPPAGWRAEGPSIAVEANAGAEYQTMTPGGNSDVPPEPTGRSVPLFSHPARARRMPAGQQRRSRGGDDLKVAFVAPDGRTWAYRGKRARVLDMLAQSPGGITQWDTLPWHTRLGGTVHALRRDGLDISTELEGDYRHARYRLHTRGRLIIQPENSRDSVIIHRENTVGAVRSHRGAR